MPGTRAFPWPARPRLQRLARGPRGLAKDPLVVGCMGQTQGCSSQYQTIISPTAFPYASADKKISFGVALSLKLLSVLLLPPLVAARLKAVEDGPREKLRGPDKELGQERVTAFG